MKHELEMPAELITLLKGLEDDWKKFLIVLEEAEQQLERDRVSNVIYCTSTKHYENNQRTFIIV